LDLVIDEKLAVTFISLRSGATAYYFACRAEDP
jgi:hypothetical protein